MAIIELNNVSKTFVRGREELNVLSNINLSVREGEFTAFMGPSGSGKSTLLNLIAGIDKPTGGSVKVNGEELSQLGSKKLARFRSANIGFIFQFYNLMPFLSAQANVELPLLLTGLSRSKRRANALTALKTVDLSDRVGHKPGQLSGGQQQRVAIARAIVADPKILVCDEPTGDLDRNTASSILKLLELLNRQMKKTIVMVTHDPIAAESAQRVLHLDKGNWGGVA